MITQSAGKGGSVLARRMRREGTAGALDLLVGSSARPLIQLAATPSASQQPRSLAGAAVHDELNVATLPSPRSPLGCAARRAPMKRSPPREPGGRPGGVARPRAAEPTRGAHHLGSRLLVALSLIVRADYASPISLLPSADGGNLLLSLAAFL